MDVIGDVLIPDPEGYPVYRDPRTGQAFKCIAAYSNSIRGTVHYAFKVINESMSDTIFWGFIVNGAGNGKPGEYQWYDKFSRNNILDTPGTYAIEFSPEHLQGILPPEYFWVENGKIIRNTFEKMDGPATKPANWKERLDA